MVHIVDCSAKWQPNLCPPHRSICVAVRKSIDLLITKLCIDVDLQKYVLWPAYKSTPQLSGRKFVQNFSTYTRAYMVINQTVSQTINQYLGDQPVKTFLRIIKCINDSASRQQCLSESSTNTYTYRPPTSAMSTNKTNKSTTNNYTNWPPTRAMSTNETNTAL